MKFLICAVFSLIGLCVAKEVSFESCGGIIKSVEVEPCNTDPCEIPRGNFATITVHCQSKFDAQSPRLTIWGKVENMEVPFPGMRRNACKGKNITCPITNGQDIVYVQKLNIRRFFPKIETIAKFDLETNDDQDEKICCFTTPVKVV